MRDDRDGGCLPGNRDAGGGTSSATFDAHLRAWSGSELSQVRLRRRILSNRLPQCLALVLRKIGPVFPLLSRELSRALAEVLPVLVGLLVRLSPRNHGISLQSLQFARLIQGSHRTLSSGFPASTRARPGLRHWLTGPRTAVRPLRSQGNPGAEDIVDEPEPRSCLS